MERNKRILSVIGAVLLLLVGVLVVRSFNRTGEPEQGLVIVTPTASENEPDGQKGDPDAVTVTPSGSTDENDSIPTQGAKPSEKGDKKVTQSATPEPAVSAEPTPEPTGVTEDGEYTSKDEVAEYIRLFGHLPENFITKKEAEALGWVSSKGNLDEVAPGKSIGGDRFGNYEGQLPTKKGRKYQECDIDFDGGFRGAKRIIYSNDGLIFYTDDHYQTFEQLY